VTSPAPPLGRAQLWLQLLVISALWGASFPLLRFAAGSMPPFALAAARGAIAALAIGAFLLWRGGGWHGRLAWWPILVAGTLNGWLPNVLTAVALTRVESAPAALIQSSTPLIVALLSLVALREERPGPGMLAGLALGFCGIATIIGPQAWRADASAGGLLLMLAVSASYAMGTIYIRRARPPDATQLVLGQQMMAGTIALALSLAFDSPGAFAQPAEIWLVLVLLGVFASAVPLSLFVLLLRRARATEAAMVGYLEPPFAALLAGLWLAEIPEMRVLAGGMVVLAGVWLATRRG
jgi:drug/metabolite transporter (DMT)-like permease